MEIYQIHERSREQADGYDVFYDRIIGSYFKPQKAEFELMKHKAKAKIRQQKSIQCEKCPLFYDNTLPQNDINKISEIADNYCGDSMIVEDASGYICENYTSQIPECSYYIEAIEVE